MKDEEQLSLFVRELHGELDSSQEQVCRELRSKSVQAENLWLDLHAIFESASVSAASQAVIRHDLSDKIMAAIEADSKQNYSQNYSNKFWRNAGIWSGSLGAGVCAVFLIFLVSNGQFLSPSGSGIVTPYGSGGTKYNDAKIANSTNAILTYIEGSFGALFMLVTGLFAIVFSITWATTRKRPHGVLAIVFTILAVLAFLIRNLTQYLFNDLNIQD